MNLFKKIWYKFLLLTYFLGSPFSLIYAQTNPPTTSSCGVGHICNPLSTTSTLPALIQNVLIGALKIGIPVVALAIIYCGFLFVEARGNPEKLTKAKDALLWTLVGAAILLGAWAIANMIQSTILAL